MAEHDRALDRTLLDPTRLHIVSLLAGTRWAEFSFIRTEVGLSDSALSKQLTTLQKLGYVDIDKGYVGKRPRTWVNLSESGRTALAGHVGALQDIAAQATTAAVAGTRDQRGKPQ
jgi:DNA-binding transcriptional ArsR family regulator